MPNLPSQSLIALVAGAIAATGFHTAEQTAQGASMAGAVSEAVRAAEGEALAGQSASALL